MLIAINANLKGRHCVVYGLRFVLITTLLTLSCAGTKITVIDSPEQNRTIYRLGPMSMSMSQDFVGPYGNASFRIDIYVSKTSGDTSLYIEMVTLSPTNWTISKGDTLTFGVNGENLFATCAGVDQVKPDDGVEMGGTLYMSNTTYYLSDVWYQADLATLRRIAKSTAVTFEFQTSTGIVSGRLTENSMRDIKEFQSKYVP